MFEIHKGILCRDSSYFRTALNGAFREAQENKIILSENRTRTFHIFQHWAYSGSLQNGDRKESFMPMPFLIDIYTFAEARDIRRLQSQALDAIITRNKDQQRFYAPWVIRVYDNTCPSSQLRKFIVDFCASSRAPPKTAWLKRGRNSIPPDFAIDLALALKDLQHYSRTRFGEVRTDFWEERHKYHIPLDEPSITQNRAEEQRITDVAGFLAGVPAKLDHDDTQ